MVNLLTPLFYRPFEIDDGEERLVKALERIAGLLVLHTILSVTGVCIVTALLVIHLAGL